MPITRSWQADLDQQEYAARLAAKSQQQAPEREPVTVACEHHNFSAHTTSGSTLDDHVVQSGYCAGCGQWLILTTYKTSRHFEARLMTAAERDRLERIHEHHRFSDFLSDLQSQ